MGENKYDCDEKSIFTTALYLLQILDHAYMVDILLLA